MWRISWYYSKVYQSSCKYIVLKFDNNNILKSYEKSLMAIFIFYKVFRGVFFPYASYCIQKIIVLYSWNNLLKRSSVKFRCSWDTKRKIDVIWKWSRISDAPETSVLLFDSSSIIFCQTILPSDAFWNICILNIQCLEEFDHKAHNIISWHVSVHRLQSIYL